MSQEPHQRELGLKLIPPSQQWPQRDTNSPSKHSLREDITRLQGEKNTILGNAKTVMASARSLKANVISFVAAANELLEELPKTQKETVLGKFLKDWMDTFAEATAQQPHRAHCKLAS